MDGTPSARCPSPRPASGAGPSSSGAEFAGRGAWILGAADVLLTPDTPEYRQAAELAATGLRVLALTRTDRPLDPGATGPLEPVAIVILRQRIRPEASQTIGYFTAQGVAIKIISGDNPESVSAIATSLGVPGGEHAVDARTLPEDDPAKLAEIVEATTVFGRVTPHQKRQIVGALQSRGHTVAMTGDGVNDVLALKDADLGVAMGSGSGATRAVAQIVLMDDSFAGLPSVVGEGRRVLANIERVSTLFLTKTFYAIVLSLLTGVIGLAFPFAPRHSTLVNALTIGIPAFFLALAPSDERARGGFVPRVLRMAVPAGIVCAAAVYLSYWTAWAGSPGLEENRTAAVITLFVATWWVLALVARPYAWWRAGLVAAMAVLFVLVLAVPVTREFFALAPGSATGDLIAVGYGIAAAAVLTIVFKIIRSSDIKRAQRGPADTLDA